MVCRQRAYPGAGPSGLPSRGIARSRDQRSLVVPTNEGARPLQLTIQTPEDALAASKESLEAISSDVGFIPNMAVGGKPMLERVLAPTLDGGA